MQQLIDAGGNGVPAALTEVITFGRTLTKRAIDVLANFDRPGTSNGPTEAINGRIEDLRGSALGFRKLINYFARSRLETGGFRAPATPWIMKSQTRRETWCVARSVRERPIDTVRPRAGYRSGAAEDAVSRWFASSRQLCLQGRLGEPGLDR